MTGTTVQAPLRFAEIQQEIKKRRIKSFTGSFRHSWKRGGGWLDRVLVPLPSSWRCRVIFMCRCEVQVGFMRRRCFIETHDIQLID